MRQLVRFDWAMKHLLRHKANFDILEGFLSELLHEPELKIENLLESESNQDTETDKFNRVDVLAKTQDNRYIIIEVQCQRQWDFLSRILYSTSKLICNHLTRGDKYQKVIKVISVNIVFFDIGTGSDYLYKGYTCFQGIHKGDILGLNKQEQAAYKDTHFEKPQLPQDVYPEYYIIKVSRFHDRVRDKLDEWIYFLKAGQIKQTFSAKGLKSAEEKLNILTLTEKERRAYDTYETRLRDEASFEATCKTDRKCAHDEGMEEGIKKGIKEGIKEGIKKGMEEGIKKGLSEGAEQAKQTVAKRLINANLCNDHDIATISGLPLQTVMALKAQQEQPAQKNKIEKRIRDDR